MPILGLTDTGRRFPRIGQLRKGAEKKGNRPGADLTYFRFVPDNKEDTELVQRFRSVYGDEPDSVKVYLPYHEKHDNFPTWKEHWVAGGLKHRCDGETCVLWLDEKSNTYKQTPKPCPGQCKPVGKLMVIIPALQRFAYVEVPTTSIWDIVRLTENLEAYEAMNGSLQGIPFVLSRQPREISTPSGKNGGRARREKWLLHLEPEPEWSRLRLTQMRKQALLPNPTDVLALPDGRHVDADTGEILDEGTNLTSLDDVDELPIDGDGEPLPSEVAPVDVSDGPAYHAVGDDDNKRKQLHAVGRDCYDGVASNGWDGIRAEWSAKIGVESANDWTLEQADKAIARMQDMIDETVADTRQVAEGHDVDGSSLEWFATEAGVDLNKYDAKGYALLGYLSRAQLQAITQAILADAEEPEKESA